MSLTGSSAGSTVSALINGGENTVWEENGPEGSGMGCRGVEMAVAESNW